MLIVVMHVSMYGGGGPFIHTERGFYNREGCMAVGKSIADLYPPISRGSMGLKINYTCEQINVTP